MWPNSQSFCFIVMSLWFMCDWHNDVFTIILKRTQPLSNCKYKNAATHYLFSGEVKKKGKWNFTTSVFIIFSLQEWFSRTPYMIRYDKCYCLWQSNINFSFWQGSTSNKQCIFKTHLNRSNRTKTVKTTVDNNSVNRSGYRAYFNLFRVINIKERGFFCRCFSRPVGLIASTWWQ